MISDHLKAFITHKNEIFTEKDLKREAASYDAQLKIKKLLKNDKKKSHSFEINESFELTCQEIESAVSDTIQLTSSQQEKVEKICSKEEMKKNEIWRSS